VAVSISTKATSDQHAARAPRLLRKELLERRARERKARVRARHRPARGRAPAVARRLRALAALGPPALRSRALIRPSLVPADPDHLQTLRPARDQVMLRLKFSAPARAAGGGKHVAARRPRAAERPRERSA